MSDEKFDADGVQVDLETLIMARLNPEGRELLNPTPIAPPVGYRRQPSLSEQIRDMVRSERLAAEAAAAGYETFEEADDFEVGDDYDPRSPYEEHFDPTPLSELRRRQHEAENPPPKPEEKESSGDQPDPGMKAARPPKSGEPGKASTPKPEA